MKTNTGWTPGQTSPLTLVFTQGLRRLSPPMDPVKFQTWILQFIKNVCFLARNHLFIFWGGLCQVFVVTWTFLQLQGVEATLQLQCMGFSFQQLLLLQRSMGSRHMDFSSCSSWALEHRLNSCGAQAQVLLSMYGLPGPGIKPVSPVLAGRFFTTEPPGKPHPFILNYTISSPEPALNLCRLLTKRKCFNNLGDAVLM